MDDAEQNSRRNRFGYHYGLAWPARDGVTPYYEHTDSGQTLMSPQYPSPQFDLGPYRGISPKNFRRSDSRIYEDVCEALTFDPAVDASEIDVQVQDSVVILKGTVPTRRMKLAAEECADRVYGVKDIYNQLRIDSSQH